VPSCEKSVVVSEVHKSFGNVTALHDISFQVERGEVIGLLGPNGAGKTTMVHILSTLTRPDRGHASVAGHDVVSRPDLVRRSIMLTSQQVSLDNMLTGRQNLVMIGRLQGLAKSEARARATTLIRDFELVDAADRRVDTYSGGMRRRIDIACGLIVRPEVAFLDEPTTGLDPRSRQGVWDLIRRFKSAGITTVLTTQYLEEADALSDRIIVIDQGAIIAEGTNDELKEHTGAGFCEIIPRDSRDLTVIADALGSLLPQQVRAALAATSDRIVFTAPDGVATVIEAMRRLEAVDVKFAEVALRRPSLDDVFFALTNDSTGNNLGTAAVPT
jgi:ABC-2 type transport system ATP-binding protein